ncbi:hypothetical protein NKG05_18040 [Oerskovia sp. M15]
MRPARGRVWAHRGQRGRARRGRRHGPALHRGQGRPDVRRGPRARAARQGQPGAHPHGVRALRAPGLGYSVEHLLPENGSDLAKMLVGTEGTLVTILEATVALVPMPSAPTLVVLAYEDMPTAADDVPALLSLGPLAVEGLDARLVDVVRRARARTRSRAAAGAGG